MEFGMWTNGDRHPSNRAPPSHPTARPTAPAVARRGPSDRTPAKRRLERNGDCRDELRRADEPLLGGARHPRVRRRCPRRVGAQEAAVLRRRPRRGCGLELRDGPSIVDQEDDAWGVFWGGWGAKGGASLEREAGDFGGCASCRACWGGLAAQSRPSPGHPSIPPILLEAMLAACWYSVGALLRLC